MKKKETEKEAFIRLLVDCTPEELFMNYFEAKTGNSEAYENLPRRIINALEENMEEALEITTNNAINGIIGKDNGKNKE